MIGLKTKPAKTVEKSLKSLENYRDLCYKTKTHIHETKTKTSSYVLEEPRDQDHGLEDYNTGYSC
jgi:hypothetical protein